MEYLKVLSWAQCCSIYTCIYINDIPNIMDELSHAILCADNTNIIVTSTDHKDLHKTVNVTLQTYF